MATIKIASVLTIIYKTGHVYQSRINIDEDKYVGIKAFTGLAVTNCFAVFICPKACVYLSVMSHSDGCTVFT